MQFHPETCFSREDFSYSWMENNIKWESRECIYLLQIMLNYTLLLEFYMNLIYINGYKKFKKFSESMTKCKIFITKKGNRVANTQIGTLHFKYNLRVFSIL